MAELKAVIIISLAGSTNEDTTIVITIEMISPAATIVVPNTINPMIVFRKFRVSRPMDKRYAPTIIEKKRAKSIIIVSCVMII
jgi:hypothetical protein